MWNSDPFGTTGTTGAGGSANSVPAKNPQLVTGTAVQIAAATFEQNLRMPGQFEDAETRRFYNYFRDYDPAVGRYVQSDPIGLRGRLSTYAYVDGKPITRKDPKGLYNSGIGFEDSINCTRSGGLFACNECRIEANDAVEEKFGQGAGRRAWRNSADSYRHCVLACCLTKKLGAQGALRVLDGHENPQYGSFDDKCETAQDLFNNRMGQDIASVTDDCRAGCSQFNPPSDSHRRYCPCKK
jgi:RHS repeat-associated protein